MYIVIDIRGILYIIIYKQYNVPVKYNLFLLVVI